MLAGAGRFHGGVQGQDVGLEGDAVDQGDDFVDLLRGGADLTHGGFHLAHGVLAAPGHLHGGLHQFVGLTGGVGGVAHGGGDLLHGGGGLLQVGGGLLGARGQLLAALGDLVGGGVDAQGAGAHGLQGGVDALDKAVELLGQLADFVLAVALDAGGEVAVAVGDLADPSAHLADRLGHQVRADQGNSDRHETHQDGKTDDQGLLAVDLRQGGGLQLLDALVHGLPGGVVEAAQLFEALPGRPVDLLHGAADVFVLVHLDRTRRLFAPALIQPVEGVNAVGHIAVVGHQTGHLLDALLGLGGVFLIGGDLRLGFGGTGNAAQVGHFSHARLIEIAVRVEHQGDGSVEGRGDLFQAILHRVDQHGVGGHHHQQSQGHANEGGAVFDIDAVEFSEHSTTPAQRERATRAQK